MKQNHVQKCFSHSIVVTSSIFYAKNNLKVDETIVSNIAYFNYTLFFQNDNCSGMCRKSLTIKFAKKAANNRING